MGKRCAKGLCRSLFCLRVLARQYIELVRNGPVLVCRNRVARSDGPAELEQPRAEHVERGVGREVDGELGESHSVCNPGCARGAVHDEADQTAVISKGSGVCVGAVQLGEREWKGTHAGDESEGALGGARRVLSLSSSAGLLVAQGVSNL